jgi:hypothetical protein
MSLSSGGKSENKLGGMVPSAGGISLNVPRVGPPEGFLPPARGVPPKARFFGFHP